MRLPTDFSGGRSMSSRRPSRGSNSSGLLAGPAGPIVNEPKLQGEERAPPAGGPSCVTLVCNGDQTIDDQRHLNCLPGRAHAVGAGGQEDAWDEQRTGVELALLHSLHEGAAPGVIGALAQSRWQSSDEQASRSPATEIGAQRLPVPGQLAKHGPAARRAKALWQREPRPGSVAHSPTAPAAVL
jgi:hypothetical protein